MHSMKKKIISILAIALLVALIFGLIGSGVQIKPVADKEEAKVASDKETVILWYTDEALTDYLNSVAVNYASEHDEIRVLPVLVSGREYLENISKASVENTELPDLFITTNDTLEKAHLAGLAYDIEIPENANITNQFPQVAWDACTYNGETIAYPFYYECAVLLYNQTYMNDWAKATAEAEIDAEEGELAQKEADEDKDKSDESLEESEVDPDKIPEESSDEPSAEDIARQERIDKRAVELLEENFPTTMEKLLAFSDMYDAPEQVDGIFRWDVTDILYNYFFIGDSINVGGDHGDDISQIDIYNEDAIKGLMEYQDLNRFFSINTDEISYEAVMDDFVSGRILFTIATTDSLKTLQNAVNEGTMEYEYAYASLPEINDGIAACSMSVTDVIAVNGYSVHKDIANDFAAYLSVQDGAVLYERTGKLSAKVSDDYGDASAHIAVFNEEYAKSVPLPKILETSNLWVKLEILFAAVWDGGDANKKLRELGEEMMLQVTGERYSYEPIEIEEEVIEEDEIIETDTLDEVPN